MRHVGRRAAHVEADHAVEAGALAGARHADDPARGTRQDRILAVEAARVGEPAVRLHELQRHVGQVRRDPVHVAREDRRQVGVDDRRVAARDQLHQRAHAMRHRDLRVADRCGSLGEPCFVVGEAITVHQHDRDRSIAVVERRLEPRAGAGLVERRHEVTAGADAFVDLDHPRVQQLRQHDAPIEQPRPVLVRDAERVAKAAGDAEHGPLALPFEQRVGRHRRAHLDRVDALDRQRVAGRDAEQVADAGHRRVAVMAGVLRQQLVRHQAAVRPPPDDVGEGTAPVDPELPAIHRTRAGHSDVAARAAWS